MSGYSEIIIIEYENWRVIEEYDSGDQSSKKRETLDLISPPTVQSGWLYLEKSASIACTF